MKYFILIMLLYMPSSLSANEGFSFFEKKIRPALKTHCYRCHSDEENRIKGGLLVDTKSGLLLGGDSGPAIVPGNLDKSILWKSINYLNDMEMPPKKAMSAAEIADFKKWILMGAPDPREQKNILVKTKVTAEVIAKGKEFWAYKKPEYHAPVSSTNSAWSKTKIDSFIYSGVEADSVTLVRRLYVDIIGLLPTIQQVIEFNRHYQKDVNSALQKTVDELLASPHFGERWGRHWLDVARYAESTGSGVNSPYAHAWRYRDYVIKSFNDDKPYDRFIQEQIAGDLLKVKTDKEWTNNLVATGFLALGPKNLADQDKRQFQADLIDEQIDVVSRGVLGISVACARCHDHKFEPIPQADYYALAGIFQSSKTYYGTLKSRQNKHSSSLIKMPLGDEQGNKKISLAELAKLKENVTKAESALRELRMELRKKKGSGGLDNNSMRQAIVAEQRLVQLQAEFNSYDKDGKPYAFCMGMQKASPTNANIFERGVVSKPGQEIERSAIQVMSDKPLKISSNSNGRLELAQWMTDESHPLTARVMVNRIWAKLMGEGIVKSLSNFGITGQAPTHPELLDYLALNFMKEGWSVKSLIKKIVLTKIYRISSEMDDKNFLKDPENKYLWRVSSRRLDAEVIRDSVLQLSGKLDRSPRYSSKLAESSATVSRVRVNGSENPYDGNSNYRSVYLPIVRDFLPSMLKVFDFTESMLTTGTREQNNTSAQALYMMNNKFILTNSDSMAKRIIAKSKSVDDRLKEAFAMCYSRYPHSNELSLARNLHDTFKRSKDLSKKKTSTKEFVALSAVCQALFASAEFRYRN
jgi:cytochrome c553